MAEASLARLLELSASIHDPALRTEHQELVQALARELNVSLPDGAPPQEEEAAAPPAKPLRSPSQERVETRRPPVPVKEHSQRAAPKPEPQQTAQVKKEVRRTSSAPPRTALTSSGPTGNADCDISSPDITSAYEQVRDDSVSTNWMLLGYGTTKKTLELYGTGEGGLPEFVSNLKEDEVTYGYVRVIYGDSQRSKFVFVTYVPEGLSGMSRAKANMHKPALTQFLKYMHIEVYASTTAELDEPLVQAKLKAAAGANYGTSTIGGTAAAGSEDYSSIKDSARNFFKQTETKGDKSSIVYHKGPLSDTTPVALTGRAGITEKYIKTELK
jgi:hypothetical protein